MKFFLLLFSMSMSLYSQSNPNASKIISSDRWTTYEMKKQGVHIQAPVDWESNTSNLMGTEFILFSTLENKDDLFRENVNLIIQDFKGEKVTLNEYIDHTISQVKNFITDSKMVENKEILVRHLTFNKLIYTGKQGIYDLEFEQYVCIHDGKAYVLTFTAEASKFASYQAIGEKILNSFVFDEAVKPNK